MSIHLLYNINRKGNKRVTNLRICYSATSSPWPKFVYSNRRNKIFHEKDRIYLPYCAREREMTVLLANDYFQSDVRVTFETAQLSSVRIHMLNQSSKSKPLNSVRRSWSWQVRISVKIRWVWEGQNRFYFNDRSFSTKGYFLVISAGRNPSHISIMFSSLMNWAEGGAGVIWRH